MTRVGPCLLITISLVALLVVSASFITVSFENPTPQDKSPRTGYLVWHPPIEDYDQQLVDATALFTVIMTFLSGYYIMKWMLNGEYTTIFVLDGIKTVSTEEFNYFLGGYCFFTSFTALVLLWFDVGKLWGTTGIFHNASEVLIMITMHQGGRIISNTSVGWLGFYVIFATSLSLFLSWPFDVIWFKIQGLCSDFAIAIQFLRMYFATKSHMRHHPVEREQLIGEGESNEEQVQAPRRNPSVDHPKQLLIPVFASIIHIIGNVASTFYVTLASLLVFLFSYSIAFPAYAYFVYLDLNARSSSPQRTINLPDTTHWKVAVVTISSITLSLLTVRISFVIAASMSN